MDFYTSPLPGSSAVSPSSLSPSSSMSSSLSTSELPASALTQKYHHLRTRKQNLAQLQKFQLTLTLYFLSSIFLLLDFLFWHISWCTLRDFLHYWTWTCLFSYHINLIRKFNTCNGVQSSSILSFCVKKSYLSPGKFKNLFFPYSFCSA